MKRVFTLLMIIGMFGLIACGSPQKEKEGTENQKEQANAGFEKGMQSMDEATDETADVEKTPKHTCDEKCKTEGCAGPRCGEKGHMCTIACNGNENVENSEAINEE